MFSGLGAAEAAAALGCVGAGAGPQDHPCVEITRPEAGSGDSRVHLFARLGTHARDTYWDRERKDLSLGASLAGYQAQNAAQDGDLEKRDWILDKLRTWGGPGHRQEEPTGFPEASG